MTDQEKLVCKMWLAHYNEWHANPERKLHDLREKPPGFDAWLQDDTDEERRHQVSDAMPLQRLIHLQRLELERCPAPTDMAMMASLRNSLPDTGISPEPSSSKSSVVASTQPVAAKVEPEETPDLPPSATPREQRNMVASRAAESAKLPALQERFSSTDNPAVTQFANAREIIREVVGGNRTTEARAAL